MVLFFFGLQGLAGPFQGPLFKKLLGGERTPVIIVFAFLLLTAG